MKCFIKSLLGLENEFAHDQNDMCAPLPPLVKSLLGSVIFIVLIAVLSHMVRI